MKKYLSILTLVAILVMVVPVYAQEPEDSGVQG